MTQQTDKKLFSTEDKIGLCPPTLFGAAPHMAARTNPYWLAQNSVSQSSPSDEAIALADYTNDPSNLLLDDNQQPSLFFSGEDGKLRAGSNLDQFVLSSDFSTTANNNFDDGSDPLLFLSDSNEYENLDSAFVASSNLVEV